MQRKLYSILACATMLTTSMAIVASPMADAAEVAPAYDDQITRLYITALGRYPDAEGQAYWANRRINGESLIDLARVMINTPEAKASTSGDFVVDAYRNALARSPEPEGHAYWLAYDDPARAVA